MGLDILKAMKLLLVKFNYIILSNNIKILHTNMIFAKSLVWGKLVSGSNIKDNISPIDGSVISQASMMSDDELNRVFKGCSTEKYSEIHTFNQLLKLSRYLIDNRDLFINQIMLDSGFIKDDAEDLVDGSIEFCAHYESHLKQVPKLSCSTSFSFVNGVDKKIVLTSSPYGLIAATTPRNTPLITELTIIVHALWSGNLLILRSSPGVSGTVFLLIEALLKSFDKEFLKRLSVIFSDAKKFVALSLTSANLIHYVGSSKYLQQTLVSGINSGVKVLVDGDGCTMVVVDKSANILNVAQYCLDGLIRCNGEICISIRAIVVEESVHKEFVKKFLGLVKKVMVGSPLTNKKIRMGPLFSFAQASGIIEASKKYKTLFNNSQVSTYGDNYISPVVLQLESDDYEFLKEQVFGPIVGIAKFKDEGWRNWLRNNPINLTDAVFSKSKKFVNAFLEESSSPRKIVNLDPTIESVFEPWGAYLPSGSNDVSYWFEKYRRYYQLVQC